MGSNRPVVASQTLIGGFAVCGGGAAKDTAGDPGRGRLEAVPLNLPDADGAATTSGTAEALTAWAVSASVAPSPCKN